MRAREVTPEEAPELHGMIDRLCALADMPKPRVGISDARVPNAFATGRSPSRADRDVGDAGGKAMYLLLARRQCPFTPYQRAWPH